jgi:predicted metal-binding membrane protein
MTEGTFPLPRERNLILTALIVLTVGGWLLLVRQSAMMSTTMPAGLTMGMRGVVIMLAGAYQLTPLKHICLSKCRTPLAFILGSWRDGYAGAFRMGLEHGAYCLGCCCSLLSSFRWGS